MDNEFNQKPRSYAITPPVNYNYSKLPYGELPWEGFEYVCYLYLCHLYGAENVSAYGNRGQKQFGFDFYVRIGNTERYRLYQCKQVESFDANDLRKAIKAWEDEKWFSKTDAFVLFSSNDLITTSFIDEFELQRTRLKLLNIDLIKMGSGQIDLILKEIPAIVEASFGAAWRDNFCSPYALKPYLNGILPSLNLSQKIYPEVPFYIERKLTNPNKQEEVFKNFYRDQSVSLYDHIEECFKTAKPAKVILKAEAATGKSKELENLAHRYSHNDSGIYPVLIRMVNFKHDLNQYIGAFYRDWQSVPPERLLLLFDGLDEIPPLYFKDFLKEFNILLQAKAEVHIVASIRSNVFTSEIGNGVEAENRLKPMYLNDLTEWEINKYINDRIRILKSRQNFGRFSSKQWVKEIFRSPFYLSGLIDLFLDNENDLPKSKSDIIGKILIYKVNKDKEKYGDTIPAKALLEFAVVLSVYLTLTGKNVIDENALPEFTNLKIPDILRCGLFKVQNIGTNNTIQFEHNNFQEYLAALKLSKLQWAKLKPILFHTGGVAMLKPKLLNTVNFLFTLLPQGGEAFQSLFGTILSTKATLLLQFEKDKVASEIRLRIFKDIILIGKAEKIYYLSGDYRAEELMDFINYSAEGFNFLLDELNTSTESNHSYCLLDLIHSYKQSKVSAAARKRLLNLMKRILATPASPYAIYDRAIDILTIYRFFDPKVLHNTIKKCPLIDHKMVRGAAIKYIQAGEFSDQFKYVLDSNTILSNDTERLTGGLDYLFLEFILKYVREENAVLLLDYFIEYKASIGKLTGYSSYSEASHHINKVYIRLGEIFNGSANKAIYDAFLRFLVALNLQPHKEKTWGNPMLFFKEALDKERIFMDFLMHPEMNRLEYVIPDLFSEAIALTVIQKYKDGAITDGQIITLRWGVNSKNRDLHDYFQELLLNNFGDKFKYQQAPDWNKIHADREQRDFELLQDRRQFLIEAEHLYKLIRDVKGIEADDEEGKLYELEYSERREIQQQINNTIIFRVIHDYKIEGGFEAFAANFDEAGWEWYVFQMVESYLVAGKKDLIPKAVLENSGIFLVEKNLSRINFNKAIKDGKAESYTINNDSIRLVHYYKHGAVKLSKPVLLQMLKLDHDGYLKDYQSGDKQHPKLFELIYEECDAASYKAAVLKNLENTELSKQILTTHAFICLEYNYEEAIPFLVGFLDNNNYPGNLKRHLVDIIIQLADDPDVFNPVFEKWSNIKSEWQLKICKYLSSFPAYRPLLIAKIESSKLNPMIKETEIFWKHDLIATGIKIGSKKAAAFQFKLLISKLRISSFVTLVPATFEQIVKTDPDWLLKQCFKVLLKYAPHIKDIRHNELPELLEEIIRQCGVKDQATFEFAMNEYERIIKIHIKKHPQVTYLKWYERRLVSNYYNHVSRYESDNEAWEIINFLGVKSKSA